MGRELTCIDAYSLPSPMTDISETQSRGPSPPARDRKSSACLFHCPSPCPSFRNEGSPGISEPQRGHRGAHPALPVLLSCHACARRSYPARPPLCEEAIRLRGVLDSGPQNVLCGNGLVPLSICMPQAVSGPRSRSASVHSPTKPLNF